MNKEDLIKMLNYYQKNLDEEYAHIEADKALLDYIDDEEIKAAFEKIDKWYA